MSPLFLLFSFFCSVSFPTSTFDVGVAPESAGTVADSDVVGGRADRLLAASAAVGAGIDALVLDAGLVRRAVTRRSASS